MEGSRRELEALRARRAAAAAARRRRRVLAIAALIAAAGVVVAIVVLAIGGGGSSPSGGRTAANAGGSGGGSGQPTFPPSWRPYRGPVPILEYHAIQPPVAGTQYPELFVPQADFEQQMAWLHDHGYEAVTLRQVEDSWDGKGELPPKPVVISFDDGYRGDYTDALPILRERGWPGNLNLELGSLEDGELTDQMIQEMLGAGWEVDSHTISHRDLTGMKGKTLRREVAGSRQLLRKRFDIPVNFFCYPAGRYNETVIAAVQAAGYLGATTTNYGLARPGELYTLARVRINGTDSISAFAQKLEALHA
jgi:peptidoglycan/xylan/chitin deacetylase (PgdA/CDA1 family)